MASTAEKIVTEALTLSTQARAFVAERLIESLDFSPDESLSSEWRSEIAKRCSEMDKGEIGMRAASEVFAKAYAELT